MRTSPPTGEAIVVDVASEKGGQAKTTTIANLATMLTLMGLKVLVVDCNPDGGLTFSFGYDKSQFERSTYETLVEEAKETRAITLKEVVVQTWYNPETKSFFDPNRKVSSGDPSSPTALEEMRTRGITPVKGPYLAPISNNAVHADSELKSAAPMTWFLTLKEALQPVLPYFDYVLVDTNPSAGCLTAVALCAGHYFYIPIVPEMLSIQGMLNLFKVVKQSKKVANPGLKLAGIVFTKVQNYRGHRDIMLRLRQELAAEYPEMQVSFFETQIQQCKDGVDASIDRAVAVIHRPYTDHAISYWFFLGELVQKVGGPAVAMIPEVLRGIREHQEQQRVASQLRRDERERTTQQ